MSTVQVRNVRKVYPDGFVAVTDIDLDISDGELFVLVGPSGCGKSSVLRMIAGLEQISGGDIEVAGTRINDVPTNTRDLSMVFQSSTLYPSMTVAENLAFPLKLAGMRKSEVSKRVAEVARMLGVSDLLGSRQRVLSGGERQRVALGRAIARQPELLLMDEPMSNLDAKLRTELRSELLALHQRLGITTVYVTHDQVEAMALGDRLAVMREGAVVQCGRPVDVYEHPVDTFVAQFLGSPPMNLLVGKVVTDDGSLGLRVGSHHISLDDVSSTWPHLSELSGRRIIVGIRPEAFRRDPEGELVLSVQFHEQIGKLQWIHAVIDATLIDTAEPELATEPALVAAVEGRGEVSLWKPLHLAVDHRQIHLFDHETGMAIEPAGPATDTQAAVTTSVGP